MGDRIIEGVDHVVLVTQRFEDATLDSSVKCSGRMPLMIAVIPRDSSSPAISASAGAPVASSMPSCDIRMMTTETSLSSVSAMVFEMR